MHPGLRCTIVLSQGDPLPIHWNKNLYRDDYRKPNHREIWIGLYPVETPDDWIYTLGLSLSQKKLPDPLRQIPAEWAITDRNQIALWTWVFGRETMDTKGVPPGYYRLLMHQHATRTEFLRKSSIILITPEDQNRFLIDLAPVLRMQPRRRCRFLTAGPPLVLGDSDQTGIDVDQLLDFSSSYRRTLLLMITRTQEENATYQKLNQINRWKSDTSRLPYQVTPIMGLSGKKIVKVSVTPYAPVAGLEYLDYDLHKDLVYNESDAGHYLALSSLGVVYGWGAGKHGQLGLGDTTDRSTPTAIESLRGEPVKDITCGYGWSFCVSRRGEVFWWGTRRAEGKSHSFSDKKVVLPTLLRFSEVPVISAVSSCCTVAFLDVMGDVYLWGSNHIPHADGDNDDDLSAAGVFVHPTLMQSLAETFVVQVALGNQHLLCLDLDGQVHSCGIAPFHGAATHRDIISCLPDHPAAASELNRQLLEPPKRLEFLGEPQAKAIAIQSLVHVSWILLETGKLYEIGPDHSFPHLVPQYVFLTPLPVSPFSASIQSLGLSTAISTY